MKRFYSHGKLLLTAEYVVLDGAKALALPTKFGQSLEIESINQPKLLWQSFDYKNNIWFEANYTLEHDTINLNKTNNETIALKLLEILTAAKQLNPMFLSENNGFEAIAKLEFPNDWGLGSSSTLVNNIAQWALVNAFNLSPGFAPSMTWFAVTKYRYSSRSPMIHAKPCWLVFVILALTDTTLWRND